MSNAEQNTGQKQQEQGTSEWDSLHRMVLGADVREIETLVHGRGRPFHVGGRREMPFVPSAVAVVLPHRLPFREVRIHPERTRAAEGPVDLLFRQLVGHPVGDEGLGVVRRDESPVDDDVIRLKDLGQFHE